MIKLVIQDCRKNPFNFSNQVSFLELAIMGEKSRVVAPDLLNNTQTFEEKEVYTIYCCAKLKRTDVAFIYIVLDNTFL